AGRCAPAAAGETASRSEELADSVEALRAFAVASVIRSRSICNLQSRIFRGRSNRNRLADAWCIQRNRFRINRIQVIRYGIARILHRAQRAESAPTAPG
ncbi:hypothetical protein, partial [Rathayibacter sp. AY1C5]|uniref:hypothetical protein n=1 Tax=Rathayibacter sp. AY1C5 TaxID=2080538 RepID=UPI001CA5C064